MSWKGVELQVALPRVQEQGQLQEQLQQRGQQSQSFKGQVHQEEMERLRKAVIEAKQKDSAKINKDSGEQQSHAHEHHQKNHKRDEDEMLVPTHPYLGKRIDYSS